MSNIIELTIIGIDCADCAATLENGVSNLEGVVDCDVSFTTARMHVNGDVDEGDIVERVKELGYGVTERRQDPGVMADRDLWRDLLRRPRNVLTLIGIALIGMAFVAEWLLPVHPFTTALFAVGALSGIYFPARQGWAALRGGYGLDMNVLMTLAAIGAFTIGEYAEAASLIVLFSVGETLEGFTMERAREGFRSLTLLAPHEATVMRPCTDCVEHRGNTLPDGSGVYQSGACPWCGVNEYVQLVDSLEIGDLVMVKPGERIPMDGVVRDGGSAVNQAPITGESIPVDKSIGSDVYAGTINGEGALVVEITHLAADNTLARLIHLVEEAQAQKSPAQRFVDRFARIYTPSVVFASVLIAVIPPLVFGQPFFTTPSGHGWLYRALAMLVIACPCALVIATPVTVVSAISSAARRGVLIKGGAYLEALGKVQVMAFDKTGTLTHGRPELAYASCDNERCWNAVQLGNQLDQCPNCDDLLALAAAVERHSGHPIARAVVRAAERRGLPKLTASSVEDIPGRGVQGWVEGSHVIVGSHDVFHENAPQELKCCKQLGAIRVTPQTTLVVSENGTLRGYVFVSDLLRSNSQEALKDLKRVGISRTIMLTGDNDIVAQLVSKSLAMDEVHSNLLPQDKVEAVRTLMSENDHVAMVGDGVNDAPALAIATVGIAMGGAGTAQALESADVALMADDLTQLPSTIRLARRAIEIIRFNIWFALIIKALFLVGALLGTVTLWMAVFADMGASLLVTFNGMRLLKHEDCSYSSPTST